MLHFSSILVFLVVWIRLGEVYWSHPRVLLRMYQVLPLKKLIMLHSSVRNLIHLVLAFMKSWWLTTWKRKNIIGVTWDTVHSTLNHFNIIFIFLYIIWVWLVYLNTFKIDIIWLAITNHAINLILIIISLFFIIFTLVSFTHTISNFHITTIRCLPLNLPVTTDHLICSLKLVEIVWVLDWYYFLNMAPSFNFTSWWQVFLYFYYLWNLRFLVIYLLGGDDCSGLLSCCCCFLKFMKRGASCKHRQAIKTI